MTYEDLIKELEELNQDEFNIDFIYKITSILLKTKDIYLNDIRNMVPDKKDKYNQMIFYIDRLLKMKIKELDGSLSNSSINSIANGVETSSLIIDDILKIEDYIFMKGMPVFSFSNKKVLKLTDDKLKDITSSDFSNFYKKINYLSSYMGKNTIRRLVDILNKYLKDRFQLEEDALLYVDSDIIYCVPMINVYLNVDLNNICEKIINNQICNIEVVITHNNEEINLFNLNMGLDSFAIDEFDADIWKLSEQNSKKKIK